MVQNHKVMLVLGLLIWYVGEAANSVGKQMVSGNVGADVDADFSDIKEASFVRKQVKADGNIDASDVEAERPIRKHAISWKVGANGEVSGPKTSLVRKQMRANASIHVSDAEAERPVRKQNDCPAGGFCSACGTCSPGRCADGSCPLFDGKCTCGDGSCPSKVASNICQAEEWELRTSGECDVSDQPSDYNTCNRAMLSLGLAAPTTDTYTGNTAYPKCNVHGPLANGVGAEGNLYFNREDNIRTTCDSTWNQCICRREYKAKTCVDCSARLRASTETGDGSFCYKLNYMVSTNPNVCDGYWSRGRNQATRSPCVYKDAASSRSGVERCESGPLPCC